MLQVGRPGFYFRQGAGFTLFATKSRPALQWVSGALSLIVKSSEHETDHLTSDVTHAWSYITTLPYVPMTWC